MVDHTLNAENFANKEESKIAAFAQVLGRSSSEPSIQMESDDDQPDPPHEEVKVIYDEKEDQRNADQKPTPAEVIVAEILNDEATRKKLGISEQTQWDMQ